MQISEQEEIFKSKFYDQMMLLKEKAAEQEIFIQQIKQSMYYMTKSFNEMSAEVDLNKKQLKVQST